MDWDSLKFVLNTLQPGTLARMVIDIEETQEAWEHDLDQAPSEDNKLKLNQVLGLIMTLGTEWGETADFDFAQLIEDLRVEHLDENWLGERNQQVRENWYEDYQ
ncbi:MAG TPA: hypothetical protein PKE64_23890 [Anaerolineae bacterium]|nr:hypothetical protein [Anaerolineae bacterium]